MPFFMFSQPHLFLSNPSLVIRHRERARARKGGHLSSGCPHFTPLHIRSPHFSFLKPHPLLLKRKRSTAPSVTSMCLRLINFMKIMQGCLVSAHGRGKAELSSYNLVIQLTYSRKYRVRLYSAQSKFENEPGRARQNSLATAGTNLVKPGAQNKVDPCTTNL